MSKQVPRVSIGVPVYNAENYLAESLDSLLGQTFEDFELIISDNGSTDRTAEICRAYAARDPRVRYLRHEENRGQVWNFNYVFERARGEYFKWAAHDDVHAPRFLARCVEVLDGCPDVAWCHPRLTHIDAAGEPLSDPAARDIGYGTPIGHRPGTDAERWSALVDGHTGSTSGPTRESPLPHQRFRAVLLGRGGSLDVYALMRREVVGETMLHLPYYGAEKVMIAELGLRGRFQEIPETLFFVRVHEAASGSMRSAAEQRRFVNPKASQWFTFTRLQTLRGFTRAILRADLSVGQRSRCFGVLLRYLFQVNKWKGIVARAFRGMGNGGGYIDHLRTAEGPGPAAPSTRQQQDGSRGGRQISKTDSPISLKQAT